MIKILNTLTREKEEFKPLKEGAVSMYLCGPTVYDNPHLGHGRSAVAFDVIRRYFIYKGYEVTFVSNYTDVDDKMINRANEEGITIEQLTEKVIPTYERDYGSLKIMAPDKGPKATEFIQEIIELIKKLEEQGAVYELDDGVYFDITSFPQYGKLSNQKLEELQMGARVEVNEKKKNPQDFALWKKEKPGEPSWDSPWGKGRPGWHIECSAMSMTILGETFDIHAGGADLMFPHHECEIAQSETASKKPFANYWLHNGFININEEKMSKSLGNFITLNDIIKKYNGSVIRFLYLQTHYRGGINFTDDLLLQAQNSLDRIHDFVRMIQRIELIGESHEEVKQLIETAKNKFEESMNDDFETPEAVASVFELVKEINKFTENNKLTSDDKDLIIEYLNNIDTVLDVLFPTEESVSDDIEALIDERNKARDNKDFARADKIRDQLKGQGIVLEDLPSGTVWKKIS